MEYSTARISLFFYSAEYTVYNPYKNTAYRITYPAQFPVIKAESHYKKHNSRRKHYTAGYILVYPTFFLMRLSVASVVFVSGA